jgi:hypothetical protein
MVFGAYRAVKIHSVVFWVKTSHSLVNGCPSFGGYATPKMEKAYSCKN